MPLLVAEQIGGGLAEAVNLPAPEYAAWSKFILTGPSKLKERTLQAEILTVLLRLGGQDTQVSEVAPWLAQAKPKGYNPAIQRARVFEAYQAQKQKRAANG